MQQLQVETGLRRHPNDGSIPNQLTTVETRIEKCSEDYPFTDTSVEYGMGSEVDEEEEEEADEWLLDGLDIGEG